MGFMDKAKKMAEQAQTKLDEAQKQFNQPSGGGPAGAGGPAVSYDEHGRPIPSSPPPQGVTPPHGDAAAASSAPPPPAHDPAAPTAPMAAADPVPPVADPAPPAAAPSPPAPPSPPAGGAPGEEEDRNRPSYAPPKLSSGDPLSG